MLDGAGLLLLFLVFGVPFLAVIVTIVLACVAVADAEERGLDDYERYGDVQE